MTIIGNSRRRKVNALTLDYPLCVTKEQILDITAGPMKEENDTVASPSIFLSQHETLSQDMPELVSEECDACPFCADACLDPTCGICVEKENRHRNSILKKKSQLSPDIIHFPFFGNGTSVQDDIKFFTPCQIRRHCNDTSAWLVGDDTIYDATEYMNIHPGGRLSILRKAGGIKDCSVDIAFHSKKAQKMW
eukprot:CAMPEP_0197831652 /NCGR_PEP_ID=MMETSP1437-20131217/11393_1 /TAXON_ID=49252 ORGANISM="Eucampia antarctica, Strain CCMP1452" /NCGR_SAMPLE_ID=MMETSP1437 /ASSEMBLY_ACC=CAM_ASM_001096 /LENGTH=191 /DNA_ID=CAMNT_0043434663 /DNA_START=133 /DNA_END=705 /DNA_ORIENTATION=+